MNKVVKHKDVLLHEKKDHKQTITDKKSEIRKIPEEHSCPKYFVGKTNKLYIIACSLAH